MMDFRDYERIKEDVIALFQAYSFSLHPIDRDGFRVLYLDGEIVYSREATPSKLLFIQGNVTRKLDVLDELNGQMKLLFPEVRKIIKHGSTFDEIKKNLLERQKLLKSREQIIHAYESLSKEIEGMIQCIGFTPATNETSYDIKVPDDVVVENLVDFLHHAVQVIEEVQYESI